MCVWTKKRGSMKAVVLMATPCPKSLHGKGLKWIGGEGQGGIGGMFAPNRHSLGGRVSAQHFAGPGLATADDCDDVEEVSRVRLRYPKQ